MSRSGQMPSDYGEHWVPGSDWSAYDDCHKCSAGKGEACWNLRYTHTKPENTWLAHPGRPLTMPQDQVDMLRAIAGRHVKMRDIEARRALNRFSLPNQHRTGRSARNLVAPGYSFGYYVGVAETDLPYGRSTHRSGYLSHLVRGILLVWKKGKLLESQARWYCGGRSESFTLLQEPNSPICPACKIERHPPEIREQYRESNR